MRIRRGRNTESSEGVLQCQVRSDTDTLTNWRTSLASDVHSGTYLGEIFFRFTEPAPNSAAICVVQVPVCANFERHRRGSSAKNVLIGKRYLSAQ